MNLIPRSRPGCGFAGGFLPVSVATENDREEWNRFVDREIGSFFHYFEWKYPYEQKERNRFIPLMIRNETGDIRGIFPVVEQPGPLYPSLSSLPEGASDGFLIKRTLDIPEKERVISSFLDFIDRKFAESHAFFSLRHYLPPSGESFHPSRVLVGNGYQWRDNRETGLPCTFVMDLERPFGEKIFPSMAKNLRNRIRHAGRCGVRVIADDDFEFFDEFARMHSKMVKKFGITRKKSDYDILLASFREKMKLFVCLDGTEPVSALLNYYTPTTVYAAMGPYTPKARHIQNNLLPMYSAIRHACDSGFRYFDMGITQKPSLAAYKEKFGAKSVPLMVYQKKFSYFRMIANKAAGSLGRTGKKESM